jgi:hypothetical protein
VVAQIAAAFAGFGSLASGLGRRKGGDDARMDAYRLEHMLETSLSATLLGLLPATLAGLAADESWGVRASALAALSAIIVFTPRSIMHARRIRHVTGFSKRATVINSLCIWGAFIAFALCALGIPADRGENLYLLGLMGLLGSCVTLFSRVIVSMLQPHSKSADK